MLMPAAPYISDEKLARLPIIVVGRWDKAPIRAHTRLEPHSELGEVIADTEAHTEAKDPNIEVPQLLSAWEPLVVERVLEFISGGK